MIAPSVTNRAGHQTTANESAETSLPESKLTHILGYLILAIGAGTVVGAANVMRAGYSVVPYWDELEEMTSYIDATHKSVLSWIWAQHNEHRILFYKSLFIVDMRFFQGRNWPMYVAIFCSLAALAIVIGYMLYKLDDVRGPLWRACFGLTLFCLFCPSQWENFCWAFQLSFVLVNVWVAAAVLCLVMHKQRLASGQTGGMGLVMVSLLAATAASFTNGNGITIWPVLIVLALLARLPWRVVAIYAIGLACIVPVYLIGYHSPSQHASPLKSIHQSRKVLEYMANYFAGGVMPDSAILKTRAIGLAPAIGLLGLIAAIALLLWLTLRGSKQGFLEFAMAGIILYAMATALITSLGRVNYGPLQAFTSRYQSFALLFWLALALWIISLAARQPAASYLIAVYLLILVVTCYAATQYSGIVEHVSSNKAARELGGVAIIAGIHDDAFLRSEILPTPIAWPEVEELRSRQLSLFSMPSAKQFGEDFAHFYRGTSPDTCEGKADAASYVSPNPEGVVIRGWLVQAPTGGPLDEVVFVAEGKIVGFGVVELERFDVLNMLQPRHASRRAWIGYAQLSEGKTLELYGVRSSFGHNNSCHIDTVSVGSY
jgi:hypothetical protein